MCAHSLTQCCSTPFKKQQRQKHHQRQYDLFNGVKAYIKRNILSVVNFAANLELNNNTPKLLD